MASSPSPNSAATSTTWTDNPTPAHKAAPMVDDLVLEQLAADELSTPPAAHANDTLETLLGAVKKAQTQENGANKVTLALRDVAVKHLSPEEQARVVTPLQTASYLGLTDTVKFLLDRGVRESAPETCWTSLSLAASRGHIDLCRALVDRQLDYSILKRDASGMTALQLAAARGNAQCVTYLLSAGSAIDEATPTTQETPLMFAVFAGSLPTTAALVSAGANMTLRDAEGRTLLDIAALNKRTQCLKHLLEVPTATFRPSDVENALMLAVEAGSLGACKLLLQRAKQNVRLQFLLERAASSGQSEICRFLVGKGANVNAPNAKQVTPLQAAVAGQHISACRTLVELGAELDHRPPNGRTPLHWACGFGNTDLTDLLLDKGANLNIPDASGFWPIHYAACNGSLSCTKSLLAKGAHVDVKHDKGMTPLHWAAFGGHANILSFLISQGASVNAMDADGSTPLLWASEHGHTECAKVLVDNFALVNCTDGAGITPVLTACYHGHVETVRLLLDNGANITKTDSYGRVPLHVAAERGHHLCVQAVLDKGGDTSAKDRSGREPVHYSCMSGSVDCVAILANRSNVNHRDAGGKTPLHWACQRGFMACMPLLLKLGAKLDVSDGESNTPLLRALRVGNLKCAAFLLEKGAKPTCRDNLDHTPLHLIARQGNTKFAALLVSKGADVNAATTQGSTPLHYAAAEAHVELVEFLVGQQAVVTSVDNNGSTPLDSALVGEPRFDCAARLVENSSEDPHHEPSALDDQVGRDADAAVAAVGAHGDVTFAVTSDKDIDTILVNQEKIKIRKSGKTRSKEKYSSDMAVTLSPVDGRQFALRLNGRHTYNLYARSPEDRAVITLVIRHFIKQSMRNQVMIIAIDEDVPSASKKTRARGGKKNTAAIKPVAGPGPAQPAGHPQHVSTTTTVAPQGSHFHSFSHTQQLAATAGTQHTTHVVTTSSIPPSAAPSPPPPGAATVNEMTIVEVDVPDTLRPASAASTSVGSVGSSRPDETPRMPASLW